MLFLDVRIFFNKGYCGETCLWKQKFPLGYHGKYNIICRNVKVCWANNFIICLTRYHSISRNILKKKIYFQKIPDEISDSSKNNTNLWIFPLSLSLSYNSIYINTITQQSDLLRQICLVRQISIKHQYMSILLSKMGTLLTDHCIYNILNITYLQKTRILIFWYIHTKIPWTPFSPFHARHSISWLIRYNTNTVTKLNISISYFPNDHLENKCIC